MAIVNLNMGNLNIKLSSLNNIFSIREKEQAIL
jgi:hypothetical protein